MGSGCLQQRLTSVGGGGGTGTFHLNGEARKQEEGTHLRGCCCQGLLWEGLSQGACRQGSLSAWPGAAGEGSFPSQISCLDFRRLGQGAGMGLLPSWTGVR